MTMPTIKDLITTGRSNLTSPSIMQAPKPQKIQIREIKQEIKPKNVDLNIFHTEIETNPKFPDSRSAAHVLWDSESGGSMDDEEAEEDNEA